MITLDDLGAWVLKGNADAAGLAQRFAARPRVGQWCVQPSYRTRLMRAGQPVLFWASGSRGRLPYGIWGRGELTGAPALDPADGRWHVPLDLLIAEPPRWVRRDELRADPRLAGLEVLRQPMGSNPSYVSVAEMAALAAYL